MINKVLLSILLISVFAHVDAVVPSVEINKISPTALFKKDKDKLEQAVDLLLQAQSPISNFRIEVQNDEKLIYSHQSFHLISGKNKLRIFLPDIRDTVQLNFKFLAGNRLLKMDSTTALAAEPCA
jgi:hypothetical protein